MAATRDNPSMQCDTARDLVSARLDGEPIAGADAEALADHLAGCDECRAFDDMTATLRRGSLHSTGAVPPISHRVLAAIEPDRSTAPETRLVRVMLLTVAVAQAAIAVVQLLTIGGGLPAHQQRHLGVFSLALAVGFAYTALRPRRVGALLPFAGALALGLVVTGVVDAASGRTPIAGESAHLLDVAGLVLMWILVQLERPRPVRYRAPEAAPDPGVVEHESPS